MEFVAGIEKIKGNIAKTTDKINEESTKNSLILPMLIAWGYDPYDLDEVSYEYTAQIAEKRDKVDFAVLKNKEPIMLVECKPMHDKLKVTHLSQVYKYFGAVHECKIAVLTNGITYKFFTDFMRVNTMDLIPFFEVDISNVSPEDEVMLRMFGKKSFDNKNIRNAARTLFRIRRMADRMKEEKDKPTDEFLGYMLDKWGVSKTDKAKGDIRPLVGKALDKFCLENRKPTIPTGSEPSKDSTATNTEEELDGYHIVRAICAKVVSPASVTINPTSSSYYCAVQLGKTTKQIIRMYFNKKGQKHVEIWNGDKWMRYDVDSVSDIYKYDAEILAAVKKRL